eukprot:g13027.t1
MRPEGPDKEWELEVRRGWDRELRGECEKWREETRRLAVEAKKREEIPGAGSERTREEPKEEESVQWETADDVIDWMRCMSKEDWDEMVKDEI